MKHPLITALLLSFIAASSLSALPAQVIIIRHAEKPAQGNDLSLKGKERSAALAPYLMETEQLSVHGAPVAIYAAASSKTNSSQRSVQTVTPLADQLKLKVKETFEVENYKKMVDEIKSDPTFNGRTVLICWEHSAIPEIARAFGALQTPSRWPGEAFDRTWLITFGPTGRSSFQNLPQRLMFGDSYN